MKREPIEFQNAVKLKGIARWNIHDCSFCGYWCGFLFNEHGQVGYDSGCECSYGSEPRLTNWGEVAEHFNMQGHEAVIEKYELFWGFKK